jgi:glycosyltransferase involved in cell wall biosynthesis
MKITVISNLYPPISRGGAEKVAQRIVGELIRRGHDVLVISTMPFSGLDSFFPFVREFVGERVYRFFPLNIYHILNDRRVPYLLRAIWHLIDIWSPFPARQVEKVLCKEKPDIVLTHNLKGLGFQAPRAIRRLNLPWIHTLHDVQLSVPSGLIFLNEKVTVLEKFFRWPYEIFIRRAIGVPDLVVSPSKFLINFYRQRNFFINAEVRVLPNPAPDYNLTSNNSGASGPLRLLFAGQLERHKGILDLLEAVNRLDIPIELHIAGSGRYSSLIKEHSEKDSRLIYHGFVSANQLEQLFNLADALVVPSVCYENSPMIIYDSLQAGVPVIASNIGGVEELIKDGQNGYLVEAGNVAVWVKTIKNFAEQRDSFRGRRQAIQASVAQYSLKKYVDKLELIMNNLIEGKKEENYEE